MPLDNLLEDDHQARLVWEFTTQLDLSALDDRIRSVEGGPGAPALDPRVLTSLWLYATLEGVGSARALAYLGVEHNAFRWLAGGLAVNYHTLSDFRTDHLKVLDQTRTGSVAVLREQNLVDLNRVAQDGMRVRASAGAASVRRKATLQECLAEAQEQVEKLKKERHDDPSAGSRQQKKARERAARERAERLHAARERLPELEAKKKPGERDKARASTPDPEATVMKMADGGFRPAYNVQFAADTGRQVIGGVAVITSGSDMDQMTPMLDQINTRPGQYPDEHLAAGGFASHEDIEQAEAKPRAPTVYVPVPEPKDPKSDRHEPLPGDSPTIAAWRERRGTEEAKEIYQDRASTVEGVNAQARNRGLTRLWVRGLHKVKAVALWFAITHNLVRWFSLRGAANLGAA
jgi:transposase